MHSQCTVNLTNAQSTWQMHSQVHSQEQSQEQSQEHRCSVRNRFRNIVCLVPDDWSRAWMCCSHDLSSPECTSNPLHNLINSLDMQADFHDIQQTSKYWEYAFDKHVANVGSKNKLSGGWRWYTRWWCDVVHDGPYHSCESSVAFNLLISLSMSSYQSDLFPSQILSGASA